MYWQTLFPVITLLLGWFLARRDAAIEYRQRRREIQSRLIVELLDSRQRITIASEAYEGFSELVREFGVSDRIVTDTLASHPLLAPWSEASQQRYEDAVNQLEAYQPALSFRLRTHNVSSLVQHMFLTESAETQQGAEFKEHLRTKLRDVALPALDAAIRTLANEQDKRTLNEVNAIVDAGFASSEESMQYMEDIKNQIREATRDT